MFFDGLDWDSAEKKALETPFQPSLDDKTDVSYFDSERRSEMSVVPFSPHPAKDANGSGDEVKW